MERKESTGGVNGISVFGKTVRNIMDFSDHDFLHVRYFRAACVTTTILVDYLVSVLSLTYWAAHGYKSPLFYCREERKWNSAGIRKIFTAAERKCLLKCPVFEPYDLSLSFKLLTRVFRELGEDVIKQIQDLARIPLLACHLPPRLENRQNLRDSLQTLFRQHLKIKEAVLKCCREILEASVLTLGKREIKLKKEMHNTFLDLVQCEISSSTAPLNIAIIFMELEYQMLTTGHTGQSARNMSFQACEEAKSFSEMMLEKLNSQEFHLISLVKKIGNVMSRIENAEELYFTIIRYDIHREIYSELNEVCCFRLDKTDLKEAWKQLCSLKKVTKDKLDILGRSEIISHYSKFFSSQLDVRKWLLLGNVSVLAVSKVYSKFKQSTCGDSLTFEQLFQNNIPPVFVLAGPMGSGKTCICHYLFQQWRENNGVIPFLQRVDLLIYLSAEFVSSGSFIPHLKKNMFPKSFEGVQDIDVLHILQKFQVFFIIDTGISVSQAVLEATKELASSLGKNNIMITTRPHKKKWVLKTLESIRLKPVSFTMEPFSRTMLKEFCHDSLRTLFMTESSRMNNALSSTMRGDRYLSGRPNLGRTSIFAEFETFGSLHTYRKLGKNFHRGSHVPVEHILKSLIEQIVSEDREDALLYPLPLSYVILIWFENPSRLKNITTVLHLAETVLDICRSKLKDELREKSAAAGNYINSEMEEKIKVLYSVASKVMKGESVLNGPPWNEIGHDLEANDLSHVCSEGLFPFLVCAGKRYSQNNDHQHMFIHPCIHEILHACNIVSSLNGGRWFQLFNNDLQRVFPVSMVKDSGGRYIDTILLICGAVAMKRGINANFAEHLVSLLKLSGIHGEDYHVWVTLLKCCNWPTSLAKAVANVVNSNTVCKISSTNEEENRGLCQLIKRGIYQPREIHILSGVTEYVADVLPLCTFANISVLPSPDFTGLSEEREKDSLLKALSRVRNITEFWGKIGEEGAAALSNMIKLHTLHLHVSSISALRALSQSLRTCPALRGLHLELDLPKNVKVRKVPSLYRPSHTIVYLTVASVTEHSLQRTVAIIKQLSCKIQQVYLTRTRLRPSLLHSIKEALRPVPIHMSC